MRRSVGDLTGGGGEGGGGEGARDGLGGVGGLGGGRGVGEEEVEEEVVVT